MNTPNYSRLGFATQGVIDIVVSACIVTNASSIRPSHIIAVVREYGIGFRPVGNDDGLKGVGLYLFIHEM